MEDLLEQVDKVESVEQIEKNIAETSQDYFMDGRVDQCNLGITRYKSLLKPLNLLNWKATLVSLSTTYV